MLKKIHAELCAACSSREASLRLSLGVHAVAGKDGEMKDKEEFAVIGMGKLTASEVTASTDGSKLLTMLLERLAGMSVVGIKLPAVDTDAVLSVRLRNRMEGFVASVAFSVTAGREIPASIPADKVEKAYKLLGWELPTVATVTVPEAETEAVPEETQTKAERNRNRRNRKTEEATVATETQTEAPAVAA